MHACATTTPEIRAAIQSSGDSIRSLAARYGVNPKTVAKWRVRRSVEDAPMGPRRRHPPALTPAEEAMCVGFRKHALLPLDDCLYALQLKFPHLTRATLHRLYRRHGISRLPALDASPRRTGRRPRREIGDFYIDAAVIRTGEGRISIFIAFDRLSRLAYADLYETASPNNAVDFLADLIAAVPYRVHRVLTSDGPEFAPPAGRPAERHPFALLCRSHGIAHDLIPSGDPWTIAPAAQPARTSGRASGGGGRSYYRDHDHLREHFFAFFDGYNFTRRLKTLNGQTPYEFVCAVWQAAPRRFHRPPHDHMPRLNNSGRRPEERRA